MKGFHVCDMQLHIRYLSILSMKTIPEEAVLVRRKEELSSPTKNMFSYKDSC